MEASTTSWTVFWAVVLVRFLLPLFIPKFPLPAILACLLLDGADQPLFTTFTNLDMSGYQSYDKALDIFYLSLAMLTTLRNWSSYPAVAIARALFYFRLAGVLVFEMTGWRPTLLLFPNTFEFFFILYELVRSRWSPTRMSTRFFVAAAATIWIAVKVPQEYWIHIARLDATDVLKVIVFGAGPEARWDEAISQRPLGLIFLVTVGAAVVVAGLLLIRRLLGPALHPLALVADPMPKDIDEAWERDRHIATDWPLFDLHLLEKVVLAGLLTVIFAQVLPDVSATPFQLFVSIVVIVAINAFLRLQVARAGRSIESVALTFIVLALINTTLVGVGQWLLLRRARSLPVEPALFSLLLLTLVVTLYDRWRPVFDVRFGAAAAKGNGPDERHER